MSCSLRSTVFIACGVTLVCRDNSALDNPGDIEMLRRQTNSGSVRPSGPNTAETSGRRAAPTRYSRESRGESPVSTLSAILTYIRRLDALFCITEPFEAKPSL